MKTNIVRTKNYVMFDLRYKTFDKKEKENQI